MSNEEYYAEGDVNSNAKGSGARANKGKVSFSMVPFHLLAGVARVFMGGKLKYAAWNWAKGMKWSSCFDCTCRHLFKWWYLGEDIDPESGEHHLDHVLCNIFMLKHYTKAYTAGDDRPSKEITGFDVWMEDMMTLFDEAAFLERNPDIKAIVEERKQKEAMLTVSEDAFLSGQSDQMLVSEETVAEHDQRVSEEAFLANRRVRLSTRDIAMAARDVMEAAKPISDEAAPVKGKPRWSKDHDALVQDTPEGVQVLSTKQGGDA